jgi:hypothetical protein
MKMKQTSQILFGSLITLGMALFAPLYAGEVDDAVSVVKSFRAALEKGLEKEAVAHIVSFPDVPRQMNEEEVARLIQLIKTVELKLWIFPQGSKVLGECAVVTIGDSVKPTPDDPFYLIRRDGKWKLLPSLMHWNEDGVVLTEGEKKNFAELEKFHDANRKKIRNDPQQVVE